MLCPRVRARLDPADAVLRVRGHAVVDAGLPDAVGDDEGDWAGDGGEFVEGQVVREGEGRRRKRRRRVVFREGGFEL